MGRGCRQGDCPANADSFRIATSHCSQMTQPSRQVPLCIGGHLRQHPPTGGLTSSLFVSSALHCLADVLAALRKQAPQPL